jgi:hypothetical protein
MGGLHGEVTFCRTNCEPYTAVLVERVPQVHRLET